MKRFKFGYRHIICVLITLSFILCNIFLFPYAFDRLIESVRDFGLSIGYGFTTVFSFENIVSPTINELSCQPFIVPFGLPQTWGEFTALWHDYWNKWSSSNNFNGYMLFVLNVLLILFQVVIFLIVIFIILKIVLKKYFNTYNNDFNKDSFSLRAVKRISKVTYIPIRNFITSLITFIKDNKVYKIIWILIWAFNFNLISIVFSLLAYCFYLVISFDFSSLYIQIYKLFCDLSPMLDFIPIWVWCIIGIVVFDKVRKSIALRSLNHKERQNRGFINSRPIVMMVCATMGKKKTTMITDIAISQDIMFRNKAFERLLENDLKFPYFPWCNLENVLRFAMKKHIIYNLATIRKFIGHLKECFYLSKQFPSYTKTIKRHLRKKYGIVFDNLLFDYDYERYGFTFDDKLKVVNIWEIIETYSQLYFIYVIESSLIQSNYSIRTDNFLSDVGNFPIWNSDFFDRDSRLLDSFSRHSHILDFDMLRLGKKIISDNVNANAFEFGVIVITEIGKERGNNLELQDKKKKDDGTNQKNDLFNYTLKMIRHSATVDNYPFVKVITDDQRPQSWGADARDLCDVIYIKDSGETKLAMPFFQLEEFLYKKIYSKFTDLYYKYRYIRSDNTLPMYLLKKITTKLNHYYNGIYNRYGYSKLTVQIENGTMDGQIIVNKYFLMNKKIYSKRFSTDCFSDFFMAKSLRSELGINDMREFETEKATLEELVYENAYFMNDIIFGLKNDDKE